MQIFGDVLHDANLWHLNRRSAAKAFAIGLFFAFMPVPFQMILAAGTAIIFHANLPLSVALVWITNPLTMPAIFYGCYAVGVLLLGAQQQEFAFEVSWEWIVNSVSSVGPALFLGSLVLGTIFGTLGYFGIRALWRYSISKQWKQRNGNGSKPS